LRQENLEFKDSLIYIVRWGGGMGKGERGREGGQEEGRREFETPILL
jgi:hypothetical protein